MTALVAAVVATSAVATACGSGRPQLVATPSSAPHGVTPSTTTSVPAPLARSRPVRVRIPAIGVDSGMMALGLQADGTLQVPPTGFPAGWYTGAPTPGELGPAIVVGHVDWAGRPGVFYELRRLKPGAQVTVAREDGTTATFRVTRVEQFAKGTFPTQAVYGDIDHAGLRLVTCGGAFDRKTHSYDDNVVAFAELVSALPA
jgi:hypothetical protein